MWQVIVRLPIYTPWTPADGLPVYGFGLMLFLAFLLTTWLASLRAPKEGIHPDTVQDLAFWIVVSGLLGARVMSLLTRPQPVNSLGEFLSELPRIWDGGIVLYGSVLGGLAGFFLAYFLVYRGKLNIMRFLDVAAPSVALGLVLGRMGCFLNGCCYGMVASAACASVTPVGFPLCAPPRVGLVETGSQTAAGFLFGPPGPVKGAPVGPVDPRSPAAAAGLTEGSVITQANGQPIESMEDLTRVLQLDDSWRGRTALDLTFTDRAGQSHDIRITPRSLGLYPTQLYEVVSMFLLFLVLMAYYPLRHNPGQVMALLMVGYGMHRFLNELLRDDVRPKGIESWGSVILIVGGVALWAWLWGAPKAPEPTLTGAATPAPPAGP